MLDVFILRYFSGVLIVFGFSGGVSVVKVSLLLFVRHA
jgi:hypothetical protein